MVVVGWKSVLLWLMGICGGLCVVVLSGDR